MMHGQQCDGFYVNRHSEHYAELGLVGKLTQHLLHASQRYVTLDGGGVVTAGRQTLTLSWAVGPVRLTRDYGLCSSLLRRTWDPE